MADYQSSSLALDPALGPSDYKPLFSESCAPGTPVAQSQSTDGTVGKAQANAAATANCVGLCSTRCIDEERGHVRYSGPLTLTVEEWAEILVAGEAGAGLQQGEPYYVSAASAGQITKTAPSSEGQFVTPVGIALSATTMMIRPELATDAA